MQIDQHNYETFFLMYVDNELSVQQKEMVEAFIQQNPNLAAELKLLLQTVSGADEVVEFKEKDRLMRQPQLTEEKLLTYLDGEADQELSDNIRLQRLKNADLKQEMEALSRLYLQADELIQYPAKEKLYRHGAVRRMDWRKLAIAASLLLCVSTWLFLNRSEQDETTPAPVADNFQPPAIKENTAKPPQADTVLKEDRAVADVKEQPALEIRLHNQQDDKPVAKESIVVRPTKAPAIEKEKIAPVVISRTSQQKNEITTPQATHNMNSAVGDQPQQQNTTETAVTRIPPIEPLREKNSLFKKIGKKLGDRALDILSDGSDNINVAGFAIRLENNR